MKNKIAIISLVFLTGCASFWDAPKNVVGVSKMDLEDARTGALFQVYQSTTADVFSTVVDLAEKSKYVVFLKDDVQGFVILMGIPGVVDTTEVGVFVTPLARGEGVKVELSSRSALAKKTAAQVIFTGLAEKFKKD